MGKTPAYIHKYNTRMSPRYAFTSAMLKINNDPDYCNFVLHPNIVLTCSCKKLSTCMVPRQSKEIWKKSLTNEFGRLANGVGTRMPHGTNIIKFVNKSQVPRDRTVTYGNVVCDIRPRKSETHRVRLIVGGYQISYPGEGSSPTSALSTAKCLVTIIYPIQN